MDMNKCFFLRNQDRQPQWHVIDASDEILGRLATRVADLLRGKGKTQFTPHADCGDYVVLLNCEKVKMTGDKWTNKVYESYSGWRGGLKQRSAEKVFEKDPTFILTHAVKGMLPKNKMSDKIMKRLKVYVGNQHPHSAQIRS